MIATGCTGSGGGQATPGMPTGAAAPGPTATTATATPAAVTAAPSPAAPVSEDPSLQDENAWYAEAEAYARNWQSDAIFAEAIGSNQGHDAGDREADGLSRHWTYRFVSPAAGRYINVLMINGEFFMQSNFGLGGLAENDPGLAGPFTDLYGFDDHEVNSVQAIQAASTRYRTLTGRDPEGQVGYMLVSAKDRQTGVNKIYWNMTFQKDGGQVYVEVDALTGKAIG